MKATLADYVVLNSASLCANKHVLCDCFTSLVAYIKTGVKAWWLICMESTLRTDLL